MAKFWAAPVTILVILTNITYWVMAERAGDTTSGADLMRFGALNRPDVWAGEYWRLVTCIFLHIGIWHLLWSTYCMPGWCMAIEQALGSGRFAIAYLLTGVAASAVSLLAHNTISAGASGACFGIIGVTLAFHYIRAASWDRFFADFQVRAILVNCAVWTAIGLTMLPMDNWAHGGGLAFGFPIGWLLANHRISRRKAVIGWIVVGTILAATVTYAVIPPKYYSESR